MCAILKVLYQEECLLLKCILQLIKYTTDNTVYLYLYL